MADEKKPKIDLKARLGKTAVGGATPPPPGAAGGIPMPTPAAATPAPGAAMTNNSGGYAPAAIPAPTPTAPKMGGGLPVPPGIPVGPPPAFKPSGLSLDPSNPLAAAVAPPTAPQRPAAPPQPQRIEVDELTVQEARKGARKQGLLAGVVFGLVLAAVGYIAGGAQETNKSRSASVAHAKSLAGDVTKSRDQLKNLVEKLEAGRTQLAQRKFPETLPKDLSSINVDFDGTKLAGVRFSGFNTDTTTGLIEYISGVQATNDRKNALMGLMARLQKPLMEQFKALQENKQPPANFVVLVNRDQAKKEPFAVLAPLQKPFDLGQPQPAEFLATDPLTKQNVSAPKLANLDKAGAVLVVPKSIEAACPSETAGQIGQLVGQLTKMINDIRGEAPPPGEQLVQDTKPGLLERADRLVVNLNKVQ
jgi:hypothetical protein